PGRRHRREPVLLQQAGEERLGEVLGLVGVVPAAADVGVERVPVETAQVGQRVVGLGRRLLLGGDDQAPPRRREAAGWGRGGHGSIVADAAVSWYTTPSRSNPGKPTITMTSPLTSLPDRARQTALSPQETQRYSRHLIMPEVGLEGQKRLKASSVLLIGAGGLGSPLALYLGAAGVGRIGLVDFDVVDFSNLQRQVLHGTPDVGRPKLQSARDRLEAINPTVRVDLYETRLTS